MSRSRRTSSRTMCARSGRSSRPASSASACLPAAHRPRRAGDAAAPSSRREILSFGYTIYGWRQVPVNIGVIGEKANATRPEIEQIMIANSQGRRRGDVRARPLPHPPPHREARRAEKASASFYICSLSCRSVIYKGMFLAEQLTAFYPDLLDERFVSNFAIYPPALLDQHLPDLEAGAAVPHARPQRRDQHAERQRQLDEEPRDPHGTRRSSATASTDLKPVIQPGGSDSAALDNVFEVLVRAGAAAADGQEPC